MINVFKLLLTVIPVSNVEKIDVKYNILKRGLESEVCPVGVIGK